MFIMLICSTGSSTLFVVHKTKSDKPAISSRSMEDIATNPTTVREEMNKLHFLGSLCEESIFVLQIAETLRLYRKPYLKVMLQTGSTAIGSIEESGFSFQTFCSSRYPLDYMA